MTDSAPNNSIQDAIARAKAGAGALAKTGAPGLPDAPIIEAASTGQVGHYTGGGQLAAASLDGFLDAGVNLKPDHWLQTANTGFAVKGHNVPIEDLGSLGLALPGDMQAFYGLRVQVGGQPQYYKTVDRISCTKTGRPWGQLVQEAAAQGQREYKGFDTRFVALQDVKDMKGSVVVPAGKTLGYSSSVTNFDDFTAFAKKVRDKGLFGADLIVTIKCDVRTNDKNPKGWGAVVFDDDFTVFTPEVAEAVAEAVAAAGE